MEALKFHMVEPWDLSMSRLSLRGLVLALVGLQLHLCSTILIAGHTLKPGCTWTSDCSSELMATRKDRRSDRTPLEESHGEMSSAPCPGDTLPWNLSKHQRVKRSKSATGEVLDPAERAVIRIAVRARAVLKMANIPAETSSIIHYGEALI
ncbi:hypothetical protein Q5P01_010855 [Channa striata]|uniref:Uncharacterized protein n=1 Tax=Channa striata TaxID=64152 RepID=A0AA88SNK6_CHASR|nr:hypothetical protein Q5P01_010855 [Channa striata]